MQPPSDVPRLVWINTGPHWTSAAVRPGLLIAWRPVTMPGQPGDWEGWVISAHSYPTGGTTEVAISQGWHLKAHIRPVRRRG